MSRLRLIIWDCKTRCKVSRPKGSCTMTPNKKPTSWISKSGPRRSPILRPSSGTKTARPSKRLKSTGWSHKTSGGTSSQTWARPEAPVTRSSISIRHKNYSGTIILKWLAWRRGDMFLGSVGIIGVPKWPRWSWRNLLIWEWTLILQGVTWSIAGRLILMEIFPNIRSAVPWSRNKDKHSYFRTLWNA